MELQMVIPDLLERKTHLEVLNLVGHPVRNVNAMIGKAKNRQYLDRISASLN